MGTGLGWRDRTLLAGNGTKIGKIIDVLFDEAGEPAWLGVNTGSAFKARPRFVPVPQANRQADDIIVAYDKSRVKNAPTAEVVNGMLSVESQRSLAAYYGLGH